ncbi:hypothetical protein K290105B7_22780 [Anaerostipes caccae]|nr:hypothetical protein ANCC_27090 [Anaerostipes caccae L1-92]
MLSEIESKQVINNNKTNKIAVLNFLKFNVDETFIIFLQIKDRNLFLFLF